MSAKAREEKCAYGSDKVYQGIDFLADPEKFVDPGFQISTLKSKKSHDQYVDIWTHIKANRNKELYYVC